MSSGNADSDGEPVNGFEVLHKVSALPVSTWRYHWESPGVRHLGPMAQDWKSTFGLGDGDTSIPVVDASGVALVSIQAVHRLIIELQEEMARITSQLAEVYENLARGDQ